ncbi:MAG: zinc ribbon domain-containing protein, partial [Nocardioides sp.]|nr:zinc ribbon domain-containing protein [Nocardioides sp.]
MGEDIEVTGSCAACGHQMQPEAHFCTSCGAPVLPPPRRRPLFVDEVEGTPQPAAALTYTGPAHSGQTTYADPPEEPSFFSNAEPVLPKAERPGRRRGPGGAILLALLIIAAAGVVGFTLGRGDDRTSTADGSSTGSPGSSAGTGSGGSPSAGPSAPP